MTQQGGGVSPSQITLKLGDLYGDLPTPTRTGYDFNGWKSENTTVTSSTRFTSIGNQTLTASWTPKSYTITSGTNLTGSSISVPSSGTFGSTISISSSGSATGYNYSLTNIKIYSGNSTSGTLLATITSTSSSWTMSGSYYSSIYVYATWTRSAKTYTLTLDRQNGTGGSSTATATYNATVPNISVPTRAGYTFGGYYTGTNGSGTQYYNASGTGLKTWTTDGSATLYAKWTAPDVKLITQGHPYLEVRGELNGNTYTWSDSCSFQISGGGTSFEITVTPKYYSKVKPYIKTSYSTSSTGITTVHVYVNESCSSTYTEAYDYMSNLEYVYNEEITVRVKSTANGTYADCVIYYN